VRTDRWGEPLGPTLRGRNPGGDHPPEPQYSADGRLYWDGQQWQPLPEATKPTPQRIGGILILAGAAAVLAAPFLPWLEASAPLIGSISRNSISSPDGQILAAVAGVGGLIGLVILVRGPGILMGVLAFLVALVAGEIVLVDYQDMSHRVASISSSGSSIIADVGPGPYLAAIGVLVWASGGLVALFGRRRRGPKRPEVRF
jgi:hypothetical protein